jgi:hypothetical protein
MPAIVIAAAARSMDWLLLAQQLVNALVLGCSYALVALGRLCAEGPHSAPIVCGPRPPRFTVVGVEADFDLDPACSRRLVSED